MSGPTDRQGNPLTMSGNDKVVVPFLERYYLHPGKYDNEISYYFPDTPHLTLDEKIQRFACTKSLRRAWLGIYKVNGARIEAFIRGNYEQLDMIDFNNLVKLVPLAWPDIRVKRFYFKEPGNLTLQDYINIANRLWMIYALYK